MDSLQLLLSRHPLVAIPPSCPVQPVIFRPDVLRTFPHDGSSFLQGLAFHEHVLYESSGQYGRSSLRILDPNNGTVLRANHLRGTAPRGSLPGASLRQPAAQYFAEGVTHWRGKLLQLTWRESSLLIYDASTLELVREHERFADQFERHEGWGITNDATHLFVSDGSNTLYMVDPDTLRVVERIPVVGMLHNGRKKGGALQKSPVTMINELEMLPNGVLLFNVWLDDYIGVFDVRQRCLLGWINGTGLDARFKSKRRMGACLNGIAFDEMTGAILITGKLWPVMYEIAITVQ